MNAKHRRDEELSKQYKNPSFQPSYHRVKSLPDAPPLEKPQDREWYWKSLLSDPLCRQQK